MTSAPDTPETIEPLAPPTFLSEAAQAGLRQPIVRSHYPAQEDKAAWSAMAEQMDQGIAGMFEGLVLPFDAELQTFAGVPTYVIRPQGAATDDMPIYLDIHGGALLVGGGDNARVMSQFSALATGLIHWSVDYRMPPNDPYPAGLDDVVAVYKALLGVRDPSRIVVGGGSAGGNLGAALMLRLKAEGIPRPAGLVLQTPEVDLTESGDSFATLAHVSVGLQSLREINLLYADGADLADPLLSPLFGDLTDFPPTLLISGTRDLFLSNTVRMHRRLREAGVEADLHVFDGRPHAGYGAAPEEQAVKDEVRAFVRRCVGGPGDGPG